MSPLQNGLPTFDVHNTHIDSRCSGLQLLRSEVLMDVCRDQHGHVLEITALK